MRCTPTIHELIVLTLPPRHRCPLTWLPASRLLLPRSGLERSDFVHWHKTDKPTPLLNVRYRVNSGKHLLAASIPGLTHMYGPAARCNVWSGRALQEVFVDLVVSGLASMYPASDWSFCSGPSWISARMRSH